MDKKWIFLIAVALLVFVFLCIVTLVVLVFFGIISIPAIFYLLGVSNASSSLRQCTFSPGFTCVTYKLHAGTGELDLDLGQGTGHKIQITNLACTQSTNTNSISYENTEGYPSSPVTLVSGNHTYLSRSDSSHLVRCTDADGNLPSGMTAGSTYTGRIYMNYTEVDTGIHRMATAAFTETYRE